MQAGWLAYWLADWLADWLDGWRVGLHGWMHVNAMTFDSDKFTRELQAPVRSENASNVLTYSGALNLSDSVRSDSDSDQRAGSQLVHGAEFTSSKPPS